MYILDLIFLKPNFSKQSEHGIIARKKCLDGENKDFRKCLKKKPLNFKSEFSDLLALGSY